MGLFDESPEKIKSAIMAIDAQATQALSAEHSKLAQEAIDFTNLMQTYAQYLNARQQFFFRPSADMFKMVELCVTQLKTQLKNIKKETHDIKHLLSSLNTFMKREDEMIRRINTRRMNVR